MNDTPRSFLEHIQELKVRLLICVASVVVSTAFMCIFSKQIVAWLILPVGNVLFTAVHESLTAHICAAFFAGLILTSPIIIYQLWAFVSCSLKEKEKSYIRLLVPLSLLLFFSGCMFAYKLIVPIALKFLLGFATSSIQPMITIANYINFVATLTLTFAVLFLVL